MTTPVGWLKNLAGLAPSAVARESVRQIAQLGVWILLLAGRSQDAGADSSVVIHDGALNLDRDRFFEALELKCEAVLDTPGTYELRPVLSKEFLCAYSIYPGSCTGVSLERLTIQQADESRYGGDLTVTTDEHGRASFTFYFDGDDLARLPEDGPWRLCISANRIASLDTVSRPPLRYTEEQHLRATTQAWARDRFEWRANRDDIRPYGIGSDFRSGEELVFMRDYDLLVGTVLAADVGGTQGRPPIVQLRTDEVLRGSAARGPRTVRWLAEPLGLLCDVGEGASIARWGATPMAAPQPGSRWILGGHPSFGGSSWDSPLVCRWPYSDSMRTYFKTRAQVWKPRIRSARQLLQVLQAESR